MDREAPPPHNLQAEENLLGAYMLAPYRTRATTAGLVDPDDFYMPANRLILTTTLEVLDEHPEDGNPGAGVLTLVADRLKARNELDRIGGPARLVEIQGSCPATSAAPRYARIIANAARLRQLEEVALEVQKLTYTETDAVKATTMASKLLRGVVGRTNNGMKLLAMEEMLGEHFDVMEARREGRMLGLQTGWHELDELMGGMRGGEFWVAAGRPAMGKSIFAGNVALEAAACGYRVLYVSLEMGRIQLLDRMVASTVRISLKRLRTGQLRDHEHAKMAEAYRRLSGAPLDILADPMATMDQIHAAVHRVRTDDVARPLLVIIDYIQLMKSPRGRGRREYENRQVEVSEISGACKRLALETDGVVLGLSQFNRSVEMRTDKRPMLSDLRESGSLEQDADVVLGLYREDYYNAECEARDRGTVDIIALKSRNTELGTARLAFLGHFAKMASMLRTDAQMAGEPEARPRPRDITEPTEREDVA